MNNKGFTLIELLTVIIILTGISLIVVGGISASLERRYEKECEEQKELAMNAAKIYFSLNSSVSSVEIGFLKNYGYFSEVSKTNRLNDDDFITFDNSDYEYHGTCKE